MAQGILRLVVLIDADDISAAVTKELLEEVARYGTVVAKRSYGDWTTQNLVGWKDHLHRHAIQPVQQFVYTKGKDSTDNACVINIMDLLYGGSVDGFCLVSNDSDFTQLATRLWEAGEVVYGFGGRKTPDAFIAACDKFVSAEVLKQPATGADPGLPIQVKGVPPFHSLLPHAVRETQRDMDWLSLSTVGSFVSKNHASFDLWNYSFGKLSDLVRRRHHYLEVKETTDAVGFNHLYIRLKQSHLDDLVSLCARKRFQEVKSRNSLAVLGRECQFNFGRYRAVLASGQPSRWAKGGASPSPTRHRASPPAVPRPPGLGASAA